MAEDRPIRMCDLCGQVDDHPRHVWDHVPGDGKSDVELGVKALSAAPDPVAYENVLGTSRTTTPPCDTWTAAARPDARTAPATRSPRAQRPRLVTPSYDTSRRAGTDGSRPDPSY
jgi:hypothetical protein